MSPAWPRYLLFADTIAGAAGPAGWRFMLQAMDSEHHVAASDHEGGVRGDRLALLAVVRGLEALDQPSAVKLVSPSSYVRRGVSRGLAEWKARGWKWDRFGRLTPVRDEDLWRRIDHALEYHRVSCRGWRRGAESALAGRRRPATQKKLSVEAAVERVVGGVISEPALLIVRGRRRCVVAGSALGPTSNRLAIAG